MADQVLDVVRIAGPLVAVVVLYFAARLRPPVTNSVTCTLSSNLSSRGAVAAGELRAEKDFDLTDDALTRCRQISDIWFAAAEQGRDQLTEAEEDLILLLADYGEKRPGYFLEWGFCVPEHLAPAIRRETDRVTTAALQEVLLRARRDQENGIR